VAGNLLCSPSTLCRHIGLLFGERLDKLFTSSDKKISGFTHQYVIGFVEDIFFSTLESGLFFSGVAVEFAGYVWTVAVSGKRKLRIRKYPDTCGQGLNCVCNCGMSKQVFVLIGFCYSLPSTCLLIRYFSTSLIFF